MGWVSAFGKSSRRYRANDRLIHCDLDQIQIRHAPRPNDPEDPENKWSNWWNKFKRCLTNKEARELASELDFIEDKNPPFNTRGQLTFRRGNRYITPDVDGHKGGVWKMLDRIGNRKGTYDALLKQRLGD